MALLLIIPSWLLVISLVLALCVAARRGDSQEEQRASTQAAVEPSSAGPLAAGVETPKLLPEVAQLLEAGRTAA